MALKIIGIEHQTGTYMEHEFDNFALHVIDEERTAQNAIVGELTSGKPIKIKAKQLESVFVGLIKSEKDLCSLLGSRIIVFFDQYKNPARIDVLDD